MESNRELLHSPAHHCLHLSLMKKEKGRCAPALCSLTGIAPKVKTVLSSSKVRFPPLRYVIEASGIIFQSV